MRVPGFLAEVPPLPAPVTNADRQVLAGLTPVIGGVLVILVALVIWAVFLRRRPRNPRARVISEDPPSTGRHHRRRHKRREHRPTNPTLAETGGLPPLKADPPQDDEA